MLSGPHWRLLRSIKRQSIGNFGRICPFKMAADRSHWTRWPGKRFYLTSNRASVIDSETGQQLNPTAHLFDIAVRMDRMGPRAKGHSLLSQDWPSQYSYFHAADRWDKTSLLRVDYPELKQMIGLPEHVKYVAPAILATRQSSIRGHRKAFHFRRGGGY